MLKFAPIFFASFLAVIPIVNAVTLFGIVLRNHDGDTLTAQLPNGKTQIRLACIDTPETTQRGGSEATKTLRSLLPKGTRIEVRAIERDRYGRLVAEVFSNGSNVNLAMVQAGEAVIYRRYIKKCAANRQQYEQAERSAKSQNFGFWNQQPVCLPSDFRKKKCK